MPFKFEKLEVWQLAPDYVDAVYELAEQLPERERYNLKSQFTRAATSIALNIAEGSTGQTDAEQGQVCPALPGAGDPLADRNRGLPAPGQPSWISGRSWATARALPEE